MRSIRKHTLFTLLLILVVCLLAACLCACSQKDDNENGGTSIHTHTWGKWVADNEITHTHTCDCGEHETENHAWNSGVITKNATCKDVGIKTFTCSDCGRTKTETVEKLDEHTYGKWVSDDTTTHTHTCSVCNKTETENHHWNDGEITESATCKNAGIKTYTCSDCGQTKTEVIEKSTVHTWGAWTMIDGETHTRVCSVCEKAETIGHTWDNGTVTKQPNCKDTGIKTYTCTDCKHTKTETLDITNVHAWSKWTSVNYENHSRSCSVCNLTETQTHNLVGEVCGDCGYATVPATIQSVDNADIDFATSTVKMLVDKNTKSVNLSTAVKVSLNSTWKLYTADSSLIATKFANLKDGENTFLIVVSSSDGLHDNTYTLSIYKSFEISVNYYDVYNSVIHTETADTGYEYTISYIPEITGYTFNHWELNDEQTAAVTPFAAVSLYADCTVNDYAFTLNPDGGTVSETEKQVTFDSAYSLPVPEKVGHLFTGWYADNAKITDNSGASLSNSKFSATIELTAHWQINSYKLTVEYDDYYHGSVSGGGTYDYDTSVTVTATTKAGYTFIGWYNGETLLDGNLSYTFAMPAENVNYTAKWCKVSAVSHETNRGMVTTLNGTYIAGENITLSATTHLGHDWVGWFNGDNLLSADLSYTIVMPSEDTTYMAKWNVKPEMQVFRFDSTETDCKIYELKDKMLSEIVIPDYVTTIEASVFRGCSSLESITLPFVGGSVKNESDTYQYPFGYIFGTDSYEGGTNVTQYYYGNSTSNTTNTIYYIPSSLKNVTITGGNILCGAFYNCSGLTSITIHDSVTTIGGSAFSGCSELTSIAIPDSVTSIGDYAFSGCTGLTSIIIPNGITSIGRYAFRGCTGLTGITIPDSVTSIGEFAFYGCTGLTSVTIPDSVTSIGWSTFYGCTGLTSVTIPDSVTSIYGAFHGCSGLKSITIPDSVTTIGGSAFSGCSGLTSIAIPDSVTSIGDYAFSGCTGLTSIIIPNGVTSIGWSAFYGCTGLTSVTIPDSVTTIGHSAFNSCTGLTSIAIPDSVTSIGDYAFSGCTELTSINYTGTLETWCKISDLYGLMRYGSPNRNLYIDNICITGDFLIPNSVTSIGRYAFRGCTGLTSITIPDSVTTIGGSAFSGCSGLTSVTIGNSVTSIGEFAFEGCTGLTSIIIPNGVTSIGRYAFRGCTGLTGITIPNSVTSIGWSAFEGCTSLSYNEFENGLYLGNQNNLYVALIKAKTSNITHCEISENTKLIADDAFEGCTGLTSIIIPNGVTSIGWSAFYGCTGLTSVTIPDSVTTIGHSAFNSCTGLTSITIPDSVTTIGGYAFLNCSGLTIYCEIESEPSGWDTEWKLKYNGSQGYVRHSKIVWDCKNK